MTPLPEADHATRRYFHGWLEQFATHVRDVDYASAKPLVHPDVIIFGTHQDLLQGLESWVATQWDNVWPKTDNFTFNLPATRVLLSADGSMATVIAPWTSTGFHQDGTMFDRPGRATMVFQHGDEGWKVVHSHMSLNRGVPQLSHGNRSNKAR